MSDFSPLTQPELIKKYFKLKTGVSRMFGLGLKNVLAVVDCILKQMETENIVNFCKFSFQHCLLHNG